MVPLLEDSPVDNLVSAVAPRAVASAASLVASGEVHQVVVSAVVLSPPPVAVSVLPRVVPAGEVVYSPHLWCGWLQDWHWD
ncbi:hypothetical protein GCM10027580_15510 [Corynebacterium faecale]